jgi:hypothetical protein
MNLRASTVAGLVGVAAWDLSLLTNALVLPAIGLGNDFA